MYPFLCQESTAWRHSHSLEKQTLPSWPLLQSDRNQHDCISMQGDAGVFTPRRIKTKWPRPQFRACLVAKFMGQGFMTMIIKKKKKKKTFHFNSSYAFSELFPFCFFFFLTYLISSYLGIFSLASQLERTTQERNIRRLLPWSHQAPSGTGWQSPV